MGGRMLLDVPHTIHTYYTMHSSLTECPAQRRAKGGDVGGLGAAPNGVASQFWGKLWQANNNMYIQLGCSRSGRCHGA